MVMALGYKSQGGGDKSLGNTEPGLEEAPAGRGTHHFHSHSVGENGGVWSRLARWAGSWSQATACYHGGREDGAWQSGHSLCHGTESSLMSCPEPLHPGEPVLSSVGLWIAFVSQVVSARRWNISGGNRGHVQRSDIEEIQLCRAI